MELIFFDCETYCNDNRVRYTKYQQPNLRLLTYKIGDNPIEIIDTLDQDNPKSLDPWKDIRDAMERGGILIGHNIVEYDLQPSLVGHKCDPNWIEQYLKVGRIHDTIYAERIICGLRNTIEEDLGFDGFYLQDLVYRYTGEILDKKYQLPEYYAPSKSMTYDILSYARKDIRYLPQIYEIQMRLIKQEGLEEIYELVHNLSLNVHLVRKYGVQIDVDKLKELKVQYKIEIDRLERELENEMPIVYPPEGELVLKYLKIFWVKGWCGFNLQAEAKKTLSADIREGYSSHPITDHYYLWKEKAERSLKQKVNLNSPKQRLESLNSLGLNLESTDKESIKSATTHTQNPILDKFLLWLSKTSTLQNTLAKIDFKVKLKEDSHIGYLREGNIVQPTVSFCKRVNGRHSWSNPNLKKLPLDIIKAPEGFIKVELTLKDIYYRRLLNEYGNGETIEDVIKNGEDFIEGWKKEKELIEEDLLKAKEEGHLNFELKSKLCNRIELILSNLNKMTVRGIKGIRYTMEAKSNHLISCTMRGDIEIVKNILVHKFQEHYEHNKARILLIAGTYVIFCSPELEKGVREFIKCGIIHLVKTYELLNEDLVKIEEN